MEKIKTAKEFTKELETRRLNIVKFLSTLFMGSGILAFLVYLLRFIKSPKIVFENPLWLFMWILIIVITIMMFYIRYFLIFKNIKISFIIIVILLFIPAIITMLVIGTTSTMPYILITTIILAGSIVLNVKKSMLFFLFAVIINIVIFFLHNFGIVQYSPTLTETDISNTMMYLFFIWITTHIAKIGYDQIEHSYQKAFDYAKKLEKLNIELDKRVRLRTRQLEKSFEEKADSIHSSAIIGNITKPMLHDLASPISSMRGIFALANTKNIDHEEFSDIINMSKSAVDQIERIIENSKNLIQKKDHVSFFSPNKIIFTINTILISELQKYGINMRVKVPDSIKIRGIAVTFERIVVNILLNAIDELKRCDKKRNIRVKGKMRDKYFILTVKDSGQGIKKEFLRKIFDPDFSLKKEAGHLGMGLPFVKSTIQKKFGGAITVRSKIGKYTEFILTFDTNYHARKKTRKSNKPSSSSKSPKKLKGSSVQR
jgi:signal transduction histidine kinase